MSSIVPEPNPLDYNTKAYKAHTKGLICYSGGSQLDTLVDNSKIYKRLSLWKTYTMSIKYSKGHINNLWTELSSLESWCNRDNPIIKIKLINSSWPHLVNHNCSEFVSIERVIRNDRRSQPRQGYLLDSRALQNTFFTAKSSNIIRMSNYLEGWYIFKISIILWVFFAMVTLVVTIATSFADF